MNWRSAILSVVVLVLAGAVSEGQEAQSPQRRNSPTGRLLDQLEKLNADRKLRFHEEWAGTLRNIIRQGPSAVPELIEELDSTRDQFMLSSLAFSLRALDDKRAVLALIRAIPRTLAFGYSDRRVGVDDAELAEFLQWHDLSDRDQEKQFSFGRSVREVFGALQSLTGQKFNEEELYHVNRGLLPRQIRAQERLYHQTAKKWADWWEAHWSDYAFDEQYSHVNLPPIGPLPEILPITGDLALKTDGMERRSFLQPLQLTDAMVVLVDLDTGRRIPRPERWSNSTLDKKTIDEIMSWAVEEGFDLMGDEYVDSAGNRTFAIRPLELKAWELGKDRWKARFRQITLDELQQEGRPAGEWLLHTDADTGKVDPKASAPFLYLTKEGTPGMLFIGVEVKEVDKTTGRRMSRDVDTELLPTGYWKGRRYARDSLVPRDFDRSKLNPAP